MKKEPLPLPEEIDPDLFNKFLKLRGKYLTETKINEVIERLFLFCISGFIRFSKTETKLNEVIERLYEVKSYSNYLEDLLDESNIKYLEIEDWIAWRLQNSGEELI